MFAALTTAQPLPPHRGVSYRAQGLATSITTTTITVTTCPVRPVVFA